MVDCPSSATACYRVPVKCVKGHHDHLIDVKSGEIIEFVDEEIEKLQRKVAEKYGYKLVDHKLELYGIKKKS